MYLFRPTQCWSVLDDSERACPTRRATRGVPPLNAEIIGCWGAAGYLNTRNAPGITIPVGLGDLNIGAVLAGTAAGADIDAGKGPGVGRKNAGEDVLVGLGEPEEGKALSAVVVGWGCEKIGVPSMPNLKVVI